MKHFYQSVHLDHTKDMWNFLKSHDQYCTMNYWNGLKSIANCVKVYDLPFKHNSADVLEALRADDYLTVNTCLLDWEAEHPGFEVGFNGRSSGYLVLSKTDSAKSILPSCVEDYLHYGDFRYFCYGDIEGYYKKQLRDITQVVQSFDKLCDDLISIVDQLTEDYLRNEEDEDKD